ncbi:lipase 3-like isoform X2 [Leptopilina heterotoma]|uniref:lipase 3-like isoform X2 n=1 Tax=Leptopilina heterotoma TaxID=63436 RepID=UPI001CA92E05|nr:lipase 3-like isoform X2 [Leptopilina heterotoma]
MLLILFSIVFSEFLINGYCAEKNDFYSSMVRVTFKAGHSLESHTVQTKDGYLLTIHRIPGPSGSTPIFLQHGILGSSDSWILTGSDSLAITLANLKYDVWLGNSRSSVYCKSHSVYKNTDEKFWNYSFHEVGTQDLPAMLNYVANYTGKKIIYIGFSMGTTSFFVMASEKPEMSANISLAFALAPVAFMNHLKIPNIKFVFKDSWISSFIFGHKSFGANSGWNVFPFKNKLSSMISHCSNNHIKSYRSRVIRQSFGTASVKTIRHLAQQRQTGKFRQYDYDPRNLEIYNSTYPPEYNISRIQIPMVLIVSKGDVFSTPSDVEDLEELLPNVYKNILVDHKNFCHYDFMYGRHAQEYVYNQIVEILETFKN